MLLSACGAQSARVCHRSCPKSSAAHEPCTGGVGHTRDVTEPHAQDPFQPGSGEAAEPSFEDLVADAMDGLPQRFIEILEQVPVIVSDLGTEDRAYGMYFGDGVARDDAEDRIVIYQDTLERDFGHDPAELRRQVEITLRHELAHHLGFEEGAMGELGL